jgi:hypothetical protein
MSMPGFTADASLYKTKGRWATVQDRSLRAASSQAVRPQLGIDPFRSSASLGLFGGWGSWLCRLWCDVAWRSCLDTCEGTWENPKPSLNCVICDQQHTGCLKGCG